MTVGEFEDMLQEFKYLFNKRMVPDPSISIAEQIELEGEQQNLFNNLVYQYHQAKIWAWDGKVPL